MNWYDDLCEYYNVEPDIAIELSTRKTGRRPTFPASDTCKEIWGMNWEEIWDSKPRETLEEKMSFYEDIGSWQSFRQCSYRKDFPYQAIYSAFFRPGDHILEYGAGVCPLAASIINQVGDDHQFEFTFVEVPCEHYRFGQWRLKKKTSFRTKLNFLLVGHEQPVPNFNDASFDFVSLMDVLEHLPNPLDVVKNIDNHFNQGGIMLETWVLQDHEGPGRSDLEEAEEQRPEVMKFLNENYTSLGQIMEGYRIWKKN